MLPANVDLRTHLANIEALIAALEQRDVDTELSSRLNALEDVWWPIQHQLDNIIYPVLTLPPEILSNIFMECLHTPPALEDSQKYGPNLNLAPLLPLQVCRTWREIALSTPGLWDSLHVDLDRLIRVPRDVRLPYPEIERIIADWFGRAGACPLTLSLCCELRRTSANGTHGILHPFVQRLQSLYLRVPSLELSTRSQSRVPLKLFSTAPRLH
ncbi:hypothetical protein B0H16DRAFT_1314453 [Mycena metata]|uniref:F-box domain-containing protein n=1 Tax=Mycena metata TaxID=1033252 RepID=A0AAD7J9M2_9AGAR|nr:hypothetical protein B0H16DRAFT_1314453 [Mycena metata]